MAVEKTAPGKPEQTSEDSTDPKGKKPQSEGSVKETIESILVAFILAFIFRAFVVEAFVIPTGSMGPTLMGAHMRFVCPDCGYAFQVNFSSRNRDDTDIPPSVSAGPNAAAACPNCGYQIPFNNPEPVYFGDRILVLKYRYLFQEPQRWDVVVFKSPYEVKRDPADPKYPDNYIKRLVGKPGESIMILDGDLYLGHHGMKPQDFKIERKVQHAQESLWRDVYDNDFLSNGRSRIGGSPWQEPWEVESGTGWQGPLGAGNASRVFHFDNSQGMSALAFNSESNHPSFDSLTDWLAYDQLAPGIRRYVSDLKLSCVYRRESGQGPMRMQLTKREDAFTAEFLPGKVTLSRNAITGGGAEPVRTGPSVWDHAIEADVPELNATGTPVQIDFSNVDYRVSVRVNRREVLATSDAEYHPDVAMLYDQALKGRRDAGKPSVRLMAANQVCSIEHLRLAKDVYYLNDGDHYTPDARDSQQHYYGSPENIQELGPDEYFVLGDNSQVSLDARFWGAPVDLPHEGNYHAGPGRVPGRFLLGKAFFVYWPAGYRPGSFQYGIEPDFGDMRFIH
jgi:signal peptidase I